MPDKDTISAEISMTVKIADNFVKVTGFRAVGTEGTERLTKEERLVLWKECWEEVHTQLVEQLQAFKATMKKS